jgi:hypothetical protein
MKAEHDTASAQARTAAIQTLLERESRLQSSTRHAFFGSPFAPHACSG